MAIRRPGHAKPRHRKTTQTWYLGAAALGDAPIVGCARYIGRVGALAIALGVGAAVATGQGIAAAEPSESSSSSGSTDSASSGSPGGAPSSSDTSGASSSGTGGPASTASSSSPSSSTESSTSSGSTAAQEPGVVHSSGGALTSTAVKESGTKQVGEDTTTEALPEGSSSDDAEAPDEVPPSVIVPTEEPTPPPAAQADSDPSAAHPGKSDPTGTTSTGVPRSPAPEATTSLARGATDDRDANSTLAAADSTPAATVVVSQTAATHTSDPATVEPVTVQAGPATVSAAMTPVGFISGIVSSVLALVGFNPLLSSGPTAPVEPPSVWVLLAWVRRQIEHTFFNQTPTANPVQTGQSASGVVTGTLNAVDADGDALTYTVVQGPEHGLVSVNPDGTFVYSMLPPSTVTGGTDSFVVKVSESDPGFRLHGLLGFLQPDCGRSTYATVTLTLTPVRTNEPPVAGDPAYTIEHVDLGTGTVSISFHVTDPDDDGLGYLQTTAPANGDLDVMGANIWTYTPTDAARVKAGAVDATDADKRDTFTITVTDGFAQIDIDVTVPVTAFPAANTVIATIPVGVDPVDVVLSPDGTGAYVLTGDGSVWLVDLGTNTRIGDYVAGSDPRAIAIGADGTRLYVTSAGLDQLTVIDTARILDPSAVANIPVTEDPVDVVLSPDGTRAYVLGASGSVSLVDTTTNTRIGGTTMYVAGSDPRAIAISADGTRLYVTSAGLDQLTVIDTARILDPSAVANIPVTEDPVDVVLSPDGTRAYVLGASGSVSLVDTTTNTRIGGTTMYVAGSDQMARALSADGTRLYVTSAGLDQLTVIDTARILDPSAVANIPVTEDPVDVVLSPDGTRAYVLGASGSVSLVDTTTNTRIGGTTMYVAGSDPRAIAIGADGTRLYVTSAGLDQLTVIDTARILDPSAVAKIPVTEDPVDVVLSPDGTRAYVLGASGSVSLVDTTTNTRIGGTTMYVAGSDPRAIAISADGTRLYVTSAGLDQLTVIDTARILDPSAVANIPVTEDPVDVVLSPDGTRAYVLGASGSVSLVDTTTNTRIGGTTMYVAGSDPRAIAISADGTRLYVTSAGLDQLTVIDT